MKGLGAASKDQGPVMLSARRLRGSSTRRAATQHRSPDLPRPAGTAASVPWPRPDKGSQETAQVFPLLLTVALRVLATAKIIILHMTYRFLFLSSTKNKIAELTFAQSSLLNFSSL